MLIHIVDQNDTFSTFWSEKKKKNILPLNMLYVSRKQQCSPFNLGTRLNFQPKLRLSESQEYKRKFASLLWRHNPSSAFASFLLTCVHASREHFLTSSCKTIEKSVSAGRTHSVETGSWGCQVLEHVSPCTAGNLSHRHEPPFCNSSCPFSKSKAKTSFTKVTEKTGSE